MPTMTSKQDQPAYLKQRIIRVVLALTPIEKQALDDFCKDAGDKDMTWALRKALHGLIPAIEENE